MHLHAFCQRMQHAAVQQQLARLLQETQRIHIAISTQMTHVACGARTSAVCTGRRQARTTVSMWGPLGEGCNCSSSASSSGFTAWGRPRACGQRPLAQGQGRPQNPPCDACHKAAPWKAERHEAVTHCSTHQHGVCQQSCGAAQQPLHHGPLTRPKVPNHLQWLQWSQVVANPWSFGKVQPWALHQLSCCQLELI